MLLVGGVFGNRPKYLRQSTKASPEAGVARRPAKVAFLAGEDSPFTELSCYRAHAVPMLPSQSGFYRISAKALDILGKPGASKASHQGRAKPAVARSCLRLD